MQNHEKTLAKDEETSQSKSAPLIRRLMAMVYDLLLLIAVLFCTAGLYTMIVVAIAGGPPQEQRNVNTGDVITDLQPVDLGFLILPLLVFVCVTFYTWFWRRDGQTLGMSAWKIKLVSAEKKQVSIWQCVVRVLFANVSFVLFGLGYFYMLVDKEGKTWHDRISRTEVILVK